MKDFFSWEEEVENPIEFHSEDVDFELEPTDGKLLTQWMLLIAQQENRVIQQISYIFCSDGYLHELNQQYLQHDTLTDVITFDYSEPPNFMEGDIFISIERVQENAPTFGVTFEEELRRVMIHGLLHLCGYNDKTPEQKSQMTQREDQALKIFLEMQKN